MTNSNSRASSVFRFPTPPLTHSSEHLYKSLSASLTLSRAPPSFLSDLKAVTAFPCRQTKPADAAWRAQWSLITAPSGFCWQISFTIKNKGEQFLKPSLL